MPAFEFNATGFERAIVILTYSAGLRKAEVLQLKPDAIDSRRMQLRVVQGKGKKDRYSLLSVKTLEFLRLYYRLESSQQKNQQKQ